MWKELQNMQQYLEVTAETEEVLQHYAENFYAHKI
jgi:hypothetical protein